MARSNDFIRNIIEKESKKKLADKMAEYILNDDSERRGYEEWCQENGVDPKEENATEHIYGVALEYMGETYTD